MTYPQQPVAAPQYPQQPPFPAQYAPAQPQYAPPMPQYPPQGYAPVPQGYAPVPPYAGPAAPPLPTGTLDGFYEQPSGGGGPSFKFNNKPIGTAYMGTVARTVTNADVRAQTDQAGRPVTFKDGRTKFVMVVPMLVAQSPEFPDGVAGWWVKGQARDELARAMAEAGAPAGPPESGATIRVTLVGQRNIPNMNPAFQYRVEYVRPQGVAPVQQGVQVQPMPQAVPVQQYAPLPAGVPPQGYAVGDTVTVAGVDFTKIGESPFPGQPHPMAAPQLVQAPIAAPVVQAAPVSAPAAPQGMDPSQAAIWAQLTGGQAPAPQPQPQG